MKASCLPNISPTKKTQQQHNFKTKKTSIMAKEKKVDTPETTEPIVTTTISQPEAPAIQATVSEPTESVVSIPEPVKKTVSVMSDPDLSLAENIIRYVDKAEGSSVKINSFIQSCYPFKSNEPPKWKQQGESKHIRGVLDEMVKSGQLTIKDNAHLLLGKGYYFGQQQVLMHKDLSDVEIICQK